jgi:hypothetical protein
MLFKRGWLDMSSPASTAGGVMATLLRLFLSTITFLVFFYATTIAMSIMYPLDSAFLAF